MRLIDAEKLLTRLYDKDDVQAFDIHSFKLVLRGRVAQVIDEIPTATDMQEVVRCKDCKMCDHLVGHVYACNFHGGTRVTADNFCCWGKRKESNEK